MVIGGAVTFVNPEPLAPFADVIAAGEAELLVPALDRRLRGGGEPRSSDACSGSSRRPAWLLHPELVRRDVCRAGPDRRHHAEARQRRARGGLARRP